MTMYLTGKGFIHVTFSHICGLSSFTFKLGGQRVKLEVKRTGDQVKCTFKTLHVSGLDGRQK